MTTSSAPSVTSYHQLLRSDGHHRWWRPPVVGIVAAALYLAVLVALVVGVVITGLVIPSVGVALDRSWQQEVDLGDPVTFALLLGLVALMLPALLLATRLVGGHPVGLLASVTGRLRSRWLGSATLLALAVWVPAMAVWLAVEAAAGTLQVRQVAPATTLILLLTTLVLVPFQAAAEEYVFRGYLAQLVGSWLPHPAFAVLLPVPLFVAGHDYGLLGAVDVAVFAVLCGWLVWRTGGLEAAIAAHLVNNAVLMSLSAVGLGDPNATDTSLPGLAVSAGAMTLFTVLVTRRADALGIARSRPLPALTAPTPTPPAPRTTASLDVGAARR